jgi:AmmeMemoRadiSam system protein B/AmmeMemoRadiSam system protein A
MVRQPVVAGQFYPAAADKLEQMIAGMADERVTKEDAIGLVLPHAGYVYSGMIAVAVVSRVKIKNAVVILGPSHTGMGKAFAIMSEGTWRTPLGDVEIDSKLAKKILDSSDYLEEDAGAHRFEHSIEVQLPILQYFRKDFKLVPIVLSHADGAVYREIGSRIAAAAKELKRDVLIIASSDMTHYEPQASAQYKDEQAIEAILGLDEDRLLDKISRLNITMCGYAPTVSLIAAAKALGAGKAELVKYQTSGDTTGDYGSVVGYAGIIVKKYRMSPMVKLAKEAVEGYIGRGEVIPQPEKPTSQMKQQAGVFVSIHKFGQLRGCIGTFEPSQENVAREIITNAISSATRDPRFPPVVASELNDLEYSVDVLTEPEPVKDSSALDPKKYGLIVECGYRKGLLLPDLEGVDSVNRQIDICCQKAGIMPHEPMVLYRFEVKRYK